MASDDRLLAAARGERLRVSARDPGELRARFTAWVAARAGACEVTRLDVPAANGMSSESLLADVAWRDGRPAAHWVVRVAPDPAQLPVYPVYDLQRQYQVLRAVADLGTVPVPEALWAEPDPAVLGSPFLVMQRVDGAVVPDMPPYTFSGWLAEAGDDERVRLRRSTLEVLAALHRADPAGFAFLAPAGGSPLRAHLANERAYYEWVAADGARSALIEEGFGWLEEHWPAQEPPAAVVWGDARIGNVMYRDFRPVAVLDWESAALAPAEVDLAWFVWMHWTFQDFATMAGLPGLPDLLHIGDVLADYVAAGGRPPQDLQWYLVYAAVRHSIVMSRVGRRMVAFGERGPVVDVDELVYNARLMHELLEGRWPAWA